MVQLNQMPNEAVQTLIRYTDVIDRVPVVMVQGKTDDLFVFVNEGEEILPCCV